MHFHDSFIAYFFLVVSLSCCHKQTSSVPLFFIIHKSNNVESEERERERELLSAVAYEDQDCVSLPRNAPSPHFPSPFRPLFIPICRLLSQGPILRSAHFSFTWASLLSTLHWPDGGEQPPASFYSSRRESSRMIQLPARLLIPWVIVKTFIKTVSELTRKERIIFLGK